MTRDELQALTRARRAEFYGGDPTYCTNPTVCPECAGGGTVMAPVGPIDPLSGQPDGTEEVACSCMAGDDHAVFCAQIDALSRAALSPAPVSAEDFLAPAERRKQSSTERST